MKNKNLCHESQNGYIMISYYCVYVHKYIYIYIHIHVFKINVRVHIFCYVVKKRTSNKNPSSKNKIGESSWEGCVFVPKCFGVSKWWIGGLDWWLGILEVSISNNFHKGIPGIQTTNLLLVDGGRSQLKKCNVLMSSWVAMGCGTMDELGTVCGWLFRSTRHIWRGGGNGITKSFRYLKWRVSRTLFSAILGDGFSLT